MVSRRALSYAKETGRPQARNDPHRSLADAVEQGSKLGVTTLETQNEEMRVDQIVGKTAP